MKKSKYYRKDCKITLNGESFDLKVTTSNPLTPSGVVFKTGSDLLFLGGVAATTLAAVHGSPVNAAINGILATGVLLAGSTKLFNFGKYNYSAIDGYRINHKINEYYKKMRALEVKKLNSNDPQIFEEKQKELARDTVNFLEKKYFIANKYYNKIEQSDYEASTFEGAVLSLSFENMFINQRFFHHNKEYLIKAVPDKKEFIEKASESYHAFPDDTLKVFDYNIRFKDDTIKNEELINKTSKNNSNDREM